MKINLIAVGKNMPDWVSTAFNEYSKRLPAQCALNLIEIPMPKRGKNIAISKAMQKESELMLAAIPQNSLVICLEVSGKAWSTENLSANLKDWLGSGYDISLLVGGPDGLHPDCIAKAKQSWSLSALTLPHPLVRVILAEQIYRAWSILQGHPYHR